MENLSKMEKISLIKRLVSGDAHFINGQIINNGVVLIQKDNEYFLNGSQVLLSQFDNVPDCTLIIIPDNGRS